MDSPASTPSQRQPQPHWIHSRSTPEHPGQPQKGRTTNTKNDRGPETNPHPSTTQGQLASTSCLSDLDRRKLIPALTNTLRCMIKIFRGCSGGDTFKTHSPYEQLLPLPTPGFKLFLERFLNDPPHPTTPLQASFTATLSPSPSPSTSPSPPP